MKPHQSRVVGAVAVAQQIPADTLFAQLTVEAQSRLDFLLRGLLAVGGVSEGVNLATDDFADDRMAAIGSQQYHALPERDLLISHFSLSHFETFAGIEFI
jgi:hypothetical protein